MVLGSNNNMRLFCASMLAVTTCVFFAASAQGSIIVPEAGVIDVDELLSSFDKAGSSSASSGTAPLEEPLERPSESELGHCLAAAPSPTGGSTSTSSTGGSGGSSDMAKLTSGLPS